jgi:hypothetical protein
MRVSKNNVGQFSELIDMGNDYVSNEELMAFWWVVKGNF